MVLVQYEDFSMSKRRGGRGSKYSDDFKRQLGAESYAAGVSVPMVAKKHGVGANRIYAWRGDARFQLGGLEEDTAFVPVELENSDGDVAPVLPEAQAITHIVHHSQLDDLRARLKIFVGNFICHF